MDSRMKRLCRRAKNADNKAACELLKTYYADIFAYLRRLCRSQTEAEDLTQQTFLKVWRSLGSFQNKSKFSTWLYRIAHNTYIDCQRKNKQTQAYPDHWWQECTDKSPGPSATAAEQQMAESLYQAVEKLDNGKKHVVHLHYYQGLSLRETARVLDISTSTVKYRLREVIKTLRGRVGIEEERLKQKATNSIAQGEPI